MLGASQIGDLQDAWAVSDGSGDANDPGTAEGSLEPEAPGGVDGSSDDVTDCVADGLTDGAADGGAGDADAGGGRLGPSVQPAPAVALEQAETSAVSATTSTTVVRRLEVL